MKDKIIHGSIAAIVAAGISTAMPPKQIVTQVTHEIAASKHAWPDLTDAQKQAFAGALKAKLPGVKVDIVCNDAGCSDLAADIDDACEDAGIESVLDKAVGPLGYGIGVRANEFDRAAAGALIDALDGATGGLLEPALVAGDSAPGYVTILIGKHPRR